MILVDDPALMAKAILRLLSNPQIRHQLGKNAYRFVSARYAWESLVPAMEALYKG